MKQRVCRECGCTENSACYHSEYGNCWWVEPDLCSHCQMIAQGIISLEDVERCCCDDFDQDEERFQQWLKNNDSQGKYPTETLREIFNAMDDEDK